MFVFSGCNNNLKNAEIGEPIQKNQTFTKSAYRMDDYVPLIRNKAVACVVNQTSLVGQTHLVDTLLDLDINITRIFAPEHGFRGKADAGEHISSEIDLKSGLPILSIYGKDKKPSKKQLEGIDVVLFDIQDVGARFYTYISTLHYVMEACAEQNIPLIVLDRPNPNARYIDGPILEPAYRSFIGMHPVPVVYGMTIGEYALMINGESWLASGVKCNLKVIPMKDYTHDIEYKLPVSPSPNLPNHTSILLYPSLCFFEGTTLSVGRGTNKQFQVIGHPKVVSDFSFTPMPNEGAKDPFLNGRKCFGEDLSNVSTEHLFKTDRLNLSYLIKYFKLLKDDKDGFFLSNLFFDKLAGSDKLRKQILAGESETEIHDSWESDLEQFKKIRVKYLLYP